jgi:hypothetical protein
MAPPQGASACGRAAGRCGTGFSGRRPSRAEHPIRRAMSLHQRFSPISQKIFTGVSGAIDAKILGKRQETLARWRQIDARKGVPGDLLAEKTTSEPSARAATEVIVMGSLRASVQPLPDPDDLRRESPTAGGSRTTAPVQFLGGLRPTANNLPSSRVRVL